MPLLLAVNGQNRTFANLSAPVPLAQVIAELNLKGDRIAVEHNGTIAPRTEWPEISVASDDRLEIVHFVGGGIFSKCRPMSSRKQQLRGRVRDFGD